MVLTRTRAHRWSLSTLLLHVPLIATAAHAQEIPSATPVLDIPEETFVPTQLTIGGAVAEIGAIARVDYDSNIFAQETGERADTKLIFRPYVTLRQSGSTLDLSARAEANVRQYLKYDSESAVGGEVRTRIAWSPTLADKVVLLTGWQHGIEDRGEPEARTITGLGPREFDTIDADLSYTRQGPRYGVTLRGTAQTFRYNDALDRNRNLDSFAFVGRGSYRVTPLINAFVEGFVNRRDFAPTVGEAGLDRDSNTYGARIGAAIDPGGTLRGDAAVGVYQFDPKDARLDGRTGLSAQIGLIYQPLPRTAVTVDGFIGNVATYLAGARAREDMRFRVGVQQEIRQNLRLNAGLIYRRSRYFGAGLTQNIYGATAELEYVLNRRLIVSGNVRYTNRNSTEPLDGFSRLRTALTFKFHF